MSRCSENAEKTCKSYPNCDGCNAYGNKMITDEQIIKALECCVISEEDFANCGDCPYRAKGTCLTNTEIFDLINRQKAEIERLRKELNIVSTLYQDEQERYKELLDSKCDRCIARDKAEAIKDFAERLKSVLLGKYCINGAITETIIDNLVKEMVGESNGNQ